MAAVSRMRLTAVLLSALLAVAGGDRGAAAAPQLPDLTTVAERSGDVRTGRYDEAVALCGAFERAFPRKARCTSFGTSPEGRKLLALVVSTSGALEPAAARKQNRPVILFQGGIHAGEIDGKDAGFRVLRDALQGKVAPRALDTITLVFVPIFNVDGHERFGKHNRANQRGPEEMGWRTTAQNLNLNRDYAKGEAPEMQAMLALLLEWDPVLYVDLHVTDGAKFRHDVSITTEPAEVPGHPLAPAARKLRADVVAALAAKDHLPLEFYPSFVGDDDPTSGFAVGAAPPRLSTPYWALRDRLGLLVETHSWRTYPERVRATYDTLVAILELARDEAREWVDLVRAQDEAATRLGGSDLAVDFKSGEAKTTIDFLGYAYEREPSPASGGTRIVYDEKRPEVWKVPLVTEVKPTAVVRVPRAGYLVPPAWAELVARKLALHGFRTRRVTEPRAHVAVETFRIDELGLAARSFEGRQRTAPKGQWIAGQRDIGPGWLFVPVAQHAAKLLVHLLEPQAPDSLVAWGFLNAAFEQKEYVEGYVLEELAERMLADDAKLRAEFLERLAKAPEFRADPARRLDFFYSRSPYLDTRKSEVPILRVDAF
jgi:hypothetical protein